MFVDNHLLHEIKSIITQAKEKAIRAVDHERVMIQLRTHCVRNWGGHIINC